MGCPFSTLKMGTPGPHFPGRIGTRVPIFPEKWGPGVPILGGPYFHVTPGRSPLRSTRMPEVFSHTHLIKPLLGSGGQQLRSLACNGLVASVVVPLIASKSIKFV